MYLISRIFGLYVFFKIKYTVIKNLCYINLSFQDQRVIEVHLEKKQDGYNIGSLYCKSNLEKARRPKFRDIFLLKFSKRSFVFLGVLLFLSGV